MIRLQQHCKKGEYISLLIPERTQDVLLQADRLLAGVLPQHPGAPDGLPHLPGRGAPQVPHGAQGQERSQEQKGQDLEFLDI